MILLILRIISKVQIIIMDRKQDSLKIMKLPGCKKNIILINWINVKRNLNQIKPLKHQIYLINYSLIQLDWKMLYLKEPPWIYLLSFQLDNNSHLHLLNQEEAS